MPVVAWRLGREPLYTYTLLFDLGLLSAVIALAWQARRRGWGGEQVLEILAWALLPALLGGRLLYLFSDRPERAGLSGLLSQPWGGGISFAGALLGGAAGLAVLSMIRGWAYRRGEAWGQAMRQACTAILGALLPGLAFAQALAWLGAAAHGAAAGRPLPLDWRWAPQMRDLYGIIVPRFPLQYLAAGLSLATWAILTWGHLRSDTARVACYALLTGWGLWALSYGLERRTPALAGLSLDQVAYLAIGLMGLGVLAGQWAWDVRRRRAKSPVRRIIAGR